MFDMKEKMLASVLRGEKYTTKRVRSSVDMVTTVIRDPTDFW
jgi:hypothetical protein